MSAQLPPVARAHQRTLLRGVVVTSLIAILLWVFSSEISADSLGQHVINVGIVTGLVGTNLILMMLLLAARIPVIDKTFGHDQALAVHARLGKPAFYLLILHGVFLTLGYAIDSNVSVATIIGELLATPDVLLAVLGLAGITVVIVSSIIAVRKLLPYEGWHIIHMLTYVSVLVSIPHQLSIGNVLAEGNWQRFYWLGLYLLAFGSIALFRFLLPISRSLRHRIVVAGVEQIAPDAVSIYIRGRNLRALDSQGGQFFMWRFWAPGLWSHAHPFSLSAVPSEDLLRLTIKTTGNASRRMAHLTPGTPVSFAGPYGVFTKKANTQPFIAVAASGIGITAVRSFVESLQVPAGSVTILLRARDEDSRYLWPEITQWALAHGHTVYESLGPRGSGQTGWLSHTDSERGVHAGTIFPYLTNSDLYVCGPADWSNTVAVDAIAAGLSPKNLHLDSFSW